MAHPYRQRAALVGVALLLSACHVLHYPRHWTPEGFPTGPGSETQPSAPQAEPPPAAEPKTQAQVAVAYARAHLGARAPLKARGRVFRYDCSGFVRAAYYQAGIDLFENKAVRQGMSGTEIIYHHALETGGVFSHAPQPGDLVFFDNTYDRNRNGRLDDKFTHVGLVEEVAPKGTVTIIHLGNAGVGRIHMTLSRPKVYRDPKTGEILNHKLRRQRNSDPARTRYLASQLFRAYGRPYRAER